MSLPFEKDSFDASLAVLTVHHWDDKARGLAELRCVSTRRVVVLIWNSPWPGFWLIDYFPEVPDIDRDSPRSATSSMRWNPSPWKPFWFRTTAPTASSARTGTGPQPISIGAYAAQFRRFRSYTTSTQGRSRCALTSIQVNGGRSTVTCSTRPSSTSATD